MIEFLWLHFSPKRGYKIQIDVFVLQKSKTNFVSILDPPKKPLVSKFSLLSCLPVVIESRQPDKIHSILPCTTRTDHMTTLHLMTQVFLPENKKLVSPNHSEIFTSCEGGYISNEPWGFGGGLPLHRGLGDTIGWPVGHSCAFRLHSTTCSHKKKCSFSHNF